MRLVSGVKHQKLWCVINGHVIHAALHGAKQVVIKMRYVNGLVYQKQEHPPYQVWGHRLQHGRVDYSPERRRRADPIHRCRHESQVLEWSRNLGHLVY